MVAIKQAVKAPALTALRRKFKVYKVRPLSPRRRSPFHPLTPHELLVHSDVEREEQRPPRGGPPRPRA
jgi:hypothetical protein